jgi:ABC-type glutathione transport system ATPase component
MASKPSPAPPEIALDVRDATFTHADETRPAVRDITFTLHRGRTLAVLGYNECGKTTLMRLILRQLRLRSGTISLPAPGAAAAAAGCAPAPAWIGHTQTALCGAFASAAALAAVQGGAAIAFALALAALALLLEALRRYRERPQGGSARPLRVGSITSENENGLSPSRTIEDLLCEKMPQSEAKDKRRAALRYLRDGRFQMFDEHGQPWGSADEYLRKGLTFGQLSGGQRHLIYVLRELAARPELLICDEMLCSLDLERKTRVLRLLQAQQREDRTAVLYLTVDFASARLVGDDVAFMKEGAFVEGPAPTERVLEYPQNNDLKEYITESKRQEEMARGRHLRAEFSRLEREE